VRGDGKRASTRSVPALVRRWVPLIPVGVFSCAVLSTEPPVVVHAPTEGPELCPPAPRDTVERTAEIEEAPWRGHPASAGGIVRERRRLRVAGVDEEWHLEWASPPVPVCRTASTGFGSCPCGGVAFGEKGALDLVRYRPFGPVERLRLGDEHELQRWDVTAADWALDYDDTPSDLASRPIVTIMNLDDYDHDGEATEFLLQQSATPCGHHQTVIVGVSRALPKLHFFASAEAPATPFVFEHRSDALALARHAELDVVQFACGDHGFGYGECRGEPGEVRDHASVGNYAYDYCIFSDLTLHVRADGVLHVTDRSRSCADRRARQARSYGWSGNDPLF